MKQKGIFRFLTGILGMLIAFISSSVAILSLVLKVILGLFVVIQSKSVKNTQFFNKSDTNIKSTTPTKEQELEDFFMSKKFDNNNIQNIRLDSARERFEREIRSVRDAEKERKKRFARVDWGWKVVSFGTGLFLFGVTVEHLNAGAIGLGILSGGLVGYIGAVINNYLFKNEKKENYKVVPQRETITAPKIETAELPQSRTDVVQKVLLEAAINLQKIDAITPRLKHPESISTVSRIVEIGKKMMDKVAEDPDKLAMAQRIFTYYCAEAVNVAEALAKMENESKPDVARILSTQAVLQKLLLLFETTELELKQDDNKSLDIDLKLLDQSLKSDLKIG